MSGESRGICWSQKGQPCRVCPAPTPTGTVDTHRQQSEGKALQDVPHPDTNRYSRSSQTSVCDRAVVQNSEWVGKVLKRYVHAEAGGVEVTQGPPYLDVRSSSL